MLTIRHALCLVILVLGFGCSHAAGPTAATDQNMVEDILDDLDNRARTPDQQLANYHVDAVILAPDRAEIRGHDALRAHLSIFGSDIDIVMDHQIVELSAFEDIVVVQGKVVGTAQPKDDHNIYPFETKNIILFKREGDGLKIWKVIYNSAPVSK